MQIIMLPITKKSYLFIKGFTAEDELIFKISPNLKKEYKEIPKVIDDKLQLSMLSLPLNFLTTIVNTFRPDDSTNKETEGSPRPDTPE